MDNIAIPMHLDAFTLCLNSCKPGNSILIAPITQPSYVGLRLDSSIIQHDIVKPVDLHSTTPAERNPRITDVGALSSPPKKHRLGVHLHWTLPRLYRTATAAAEGAKGFPNQTGKANPNLVFPRVPNRWLVVRHLKSSEPDKPGGKDPPKFASWVVESDRLRTIDELGAEIDLEQDVTPFVSYDGQNKSETLMAQAEVFIGNRVPASGYVENKDGKYVPLTIMNSSNPLFPDYTPHNGNVFSTVDNFSYPDDSQPGGTSYLTKAVADYFVLGWHSEAQFDPLGAAGAELSVRLADLLLRLNIGTKDNPDEKAIDIGKNFRDVTRVLCHSSVYNVQYDRNNRTPSKADKSAQNFTKDIKMEPISVGSTAIDGIISFLDAHQNDAQAEHAFGADGKLLAQYVVELGSLIYAADEGYDSGVKAQDLVWRNNYAPIDGGNEWTYDGRSTPGAAPASPSRTPDPKTKVSEMDILLSLNEAQARLDVANRKRKSLKWELFAEWWKFVSDQSNNNVSTVDVYREKVKAIRVPLEKLERLVQTLSEEIQIKSKQIPVKQSVKPPYYVRKDPTLCIAGLDSGWPDDYMKPAEVRLHHQLRNDSSDSVDGLLFGNKSPLPDAHGLRQTASKLLAEFLNEPKADGSMGKLGSQPWNNTNPFVPLFVEYELLYYHVDFEKWDVRTRPSPFAHGASYVRYGIGSNIPPLYSKPENQQDARTISGRVMILPQPVFDLAATIMQVTSNPGPGFPLTSKQIKELQDRIQQLKFISCPLTGVTDHLLTRCGGHHIKPNVRGLRGEKIEPLQAAIDATTIDGLGGPVFDRQALELIGAESGLTPYGNLMDFGKDKHPGVPFKGVTHGQMMFTKLSIIDKFGQAIALPTPRPRSRRDNGPPPSIYPCLSDSVAPDILTFDKLTRLNTIFQEPDLEEHKWPLSRFIELTPSINQEARINAAWVSRKFNKAGQLSWQETSDYDQPAGPVWGWIVINYADSGLQFFLGDGTFYREVRMGGMTGTTTGAKWLPFDEQPRPGDPTLANNVQMDALISRLKSGYLQSFFDMINGSIKTMPFPPSDYSQFANAIVGKPLALVNVGWSLELAAPAIKAQNTLGNLPKKNEADILADYKFPVKLGDVDRPFDGVIGYWDVDNFPGAIDTKFDVTYSYFVPNETENFKAIAPSNFPRLKPTYIEPEMENMTEAIARMTAFFRLGPQLLPNDIPTSYSAGEHATPDTWFKISTMPSPQTIRLPIAGKKGLWKWLQPYYVDDKTKFNSMDVVEENGRMSGVSSGAASGPYTFVEGYLQLARGLGREDIRI